MNLPLLIETTLLATHTHTCNLVNLHLWVAHWRAGGAKASYDLMCFDMGSHSEPWFTNYPKKLKNQFRKNN